MRIFVVFVLLSVCCCLFVTEATGQSNVTGSDQPVKVNVGKDVILPCHLEPPFNVSTLTVEWKRNKTYVHLHRNKEHNKDHQDRHFVNRTSLFHNEMEKGNISLLLKNVRKEDEGIYTCHVPKLHSQVKKGNITLEVDATESNRMNEINGSSNTDSTNNTVSAGVIGGSVVGAIAIIAVIIGVTVYLLCNRRPTRRQNNDRNDGQDEEPGDIPLQQLGQPNTDNLSNSLVSQQDSN